ncbi:helix-turn-helix domain-containing protein [Yaniella sp.]|uniref:helix-turn-helix domain-containing protein n=1 Tax=Yaniella sp. TaxID=2773929 RepID=UPI003461CE68
MLPRPRPTQPIQEDIRELAELGWSQREIAKRLGISRDSVAKYSAQQDFSPKPPAPMKRPGGSVVATYEPIIDQGLTPTTKGGVINSGIPPAESLTGSLPSTATPAHIRRCNAM